MTKILNLTGIRFYLFLIVFLRHFDWINQNYSILPSLHTLHLVYFAVTFFFILSGFCISLGYNKKFCNIQKDILTNFYKKRFAKLYPLYLLTGIIFLLFMFIPIDFNYLYKFLLFYVPMLSPWFGVDNSVHGGNGVGWFVDALMFCYITVPFWGYLSGQLQKINFFLKRNIHIEWFVLLLLWLVLILILLFFGKKYAVFLYYFPLSRMFQFFIGYTLGSLYKKYEKHNLFNVSAKSFFDAIFLLVLFIFVYAVGASSWHTVLTLDYLLYTPLICVALIYLCLSGDSILNKVLGSKFSLFLAGISMEAYLIHYIFIQFTSKFMVVNTKSEVITMFFVLLGLTMLCSIGYKSLQNKTEMIIRSK